MRKSYEVYTYYPKLRNYSQCNQMNSNDYYLFIAQEHTGSWGKHPAFLLLVVKLIQNYYY